MISFLHVAHFFNVDNSVNMHNPELKLSICIKNIVIEKTASQNFDIGPSSISENIFKEK